MGTISKLYDSTEEIIINLDLDAIGQETANIVEAIFMLKRNANEADESAVMTKTIANGGIIILGEDIKIQFVAADYDDVAIKNKYLIAFGIKFDALETTKYSEIDLSDDTIKFVQDKIRA